MQASLVGRFYGGSTSGRLFGIMRAFRHAEAIGAVRDLNTGGYFHIDLLLDLIF
jgi:hypothetical protein